MFNRTLSGGIPKEATEWKQKMAKVQFRDIMGILGGDVNAYLSDRIFEIVDFDRDNYISYDEYLTIMHIL